MVFDSEMWHPNSECCTDDGWSGGGRTRKILADGEEARGVVADTRRCHWDVTAELCVR